MLSIILFSAVVGFFLYDPKALPGLWHARILTVLVKHLVWRRNSAITETPSPSTIFRPLRTCSYCSLNEIDFNLHKSNSTFYADLDISRIELLVVLFKDAITPLAPRANLAPENAYSRRNRRRPLLFLLGGVACIFKREIKPYQRYEVVSRVLTWDEKWVYIVSYFVKPGGRQPAEITEDSILASALSKYVFKQGRQTRDPAGVLRELGLAGDPDAAAGDRLPLPCQDLLDQGAGAAAAWTWAHVEAERQRGLAIAQHMAGLDGLMG
ncbi:hypothetical protein ASPZODRAFT_105211 [Penicilliopsis zonata CBS 506.65]|uniref:Thioesterase domain-containing protein n=1 Tax=Penicilliopsis zonata CBS 506.65 TaxID=1073090 RepID=A0A1L9S5Q2_9EURO|nr:hypothetical protein ASPZODRAFT_105211 [Penicilliopsis zonata CBS 506.65]OJJ42488.1 hypothetical protein ASPZODRAFT_105211 [Penicilliopsis zonata CBS 506.65]